MSSDTAHSPSDDKEPTRRAFLDAATGAFMTGGLVAGYGAFAGIAGCFLYPSKGQAKQWFYVARVEQLHLGDALVYRTPAGATVAVARQEQAGTVEDFIALSSTCPHLGCQVHWEGQNHRFFCPCHNGIFDPAGKATAGPPAEAGQSLPHFPLRVDRGLLFLQVPVETLG